MAFRKGKQKTGGRKKGTPNKITQNTRSIIDSIVNSELNNISDKLDELDAKQRMEIIIKLLPYVLPKYQHIENSDSSEEEEENIMDIIQNQMIVNKSDNNHE